MRYLGAMVTKLLLNNDFIEEEDKIEIKQQFDESFDKANQSSSKIMQFINALMNHPLGVLLSILFYTFIDRQIKNTQRVSQDEDLNLEIKKQMKQNILLELENEHK